jgi:hypothetical protein
MLQGRDRGVQLRYLQLHQRWERRVCVHTRRRLLYVLAATVHARDPLRALRRRILHRGHRGAGRLYRRPMPNSPVHRQCAVPAGPGVRPEHWRLLQSLSLGVIRVSAAGIAVDPRRFPGRRPGSIGLSDRDAPKTPRRLWSSPPLCSGCAVPILDGGSASRHRLMVGRLVVPTIRCPRRRHRIAVYCHRPATAPRKCSIPPPPPTAVPRAQRPQERRIADHPGRAGVRLRPLQPRRRREAPRVPGGLARLRPEAHRRAQGGAAASA